MEEEKLIACPSASSLSTLRRLLLVPVVEVVVMKLKWMQLGLTVVVVVVVRLSSWKEEERRAG